MIALAFSTVSVVASGGIIQRLIDLSYQGRATDVSKTVAAILDAEQAETLKNAVMEIYHATDEKVMSDAWGTPEFDAYCARYSHLEQSAEFVALRQMLRHIQDANDVDCVYLVTIAALPAASTRCMRKTGNCSRTPASASGRTSPIRSPTAGLSRQACRSTRRRGPSPAMRLSISPWSRSARSKAALR